MMDARERRGGDQGARHRPGAGGAAAPLIAERRPRRRGRAASLRRRLRAAPELRHRARAPRPRRVYAEVTGAFDFADARGERPIAVRAFTPTLARARLRAARARWWRRARRTCRSCSTPCARRCSPRPGGSSASSTRSSASSATPTATSPRCCTRARAARASRSCTSSSTAGSRPRRSSARRSTSGPCSGDVRRAVLDFPAMSDRARRMVHFAGAGAARYADDEVDETVAFLEWLQRDNFIFLGYREYRIADETVAVVPGSGPRHPGRRGELGLRASAPRWTSCPTRCARASSRATC